MIGDVLSDAHANLLHELKHYPEEWERLPENVRDVIDLAVNLLRTARVMVDTHQMSRVVDGH